MILVRKKTTLIAMSIDSFLLQQHLLSWFSEKGRQNLPWRVTPSPYAVLVSEFMLQQTTVTTVLPHFLSWMKLFPSLEALAKAPENAILHQWQGLGYYSRARRLHQVAKILVSDYKGEIPSDKKRLEALPGIGRYTASAILAFGFNQSVPVIDTNISRVIARYYQVQTPIDTKEGYQEIERALLSLLPQENGFLFNSALMDLGALICTSQNPKCPLCPWSQSCPKKEIELLPRKKVLPSITSLSEKRLFIFKEGTLYLEQSQGPYWKNLWILPLSEKESEEETKPLTKIIYPITRYRITMNLYYSNTTLRENLIPFSLKDLSHIPIASPHRKAINKALKLF